MRPSLHRVAGPGHKPEINSGLPRGIQLQEIPTFHQRLFVILNVRCGEPINLSFLLHMSQKESWDLDSEGFFIVESDINMCVSQNTIVKMILRRKHLKEYTGMAMYIIQCRCKKSCAFQYYLRLVQMQSSAEIITRPIE